MPAKAHRAHLLALVASLLLAGCAAGPSELPPVPDPIAPGGSQPAPGIEWKNFTGPMSPGNCWSIDARFTPPSVSSWWIRSSAPISVLVANWTEHPAWDTLCFRGAPDPELSRLNVTEAHDERVVLDGLDGYEIALACESDEPCDMTFAWQRVQGRHENGTLMWAGEIGPAPWS